MLTISFSVFNLCSMQDSILNKKFKYSYSNVATILVLINVGVFLATNYLNISIYGIPLLYWLSIVPGFIRQGFVWQFVTYMFVHSSFSHLLFNMYALLMFGMTLERAIGSKEFLLFYLLTGTIGGVLSWLSGMIFQSPNAIILGASGAVYAILFLSSVFYPTARILLFFCIPLKMPLAVLFFIGFECFFEITGSADGVAHLVHLLSILVAWIYCLVRFRISPLKVYKSVL